MRRLAFAAAGGDRAAFELIHARFRGGLIAFFQRRGAREASEDLAQQTWAAVWKTLNKGVYDPNRASISTFIFAIAHKIWLQQWRGARSENTSAGEALDLVAQQGAVASDDVLAQAELVEAVRRAMGAAGLGEDERAILIEAAKGASDRELAARFSLAPSTVNARKQAGWGKVRRYLARMGFRVDSAERGETDGE